MCRVLLVDDEKNVLKTLSIGLRRYEYVVRQAQNGPEALQIMKEDPCDIVVSDIRMTPMDGYTLASRLHEQYPDLGIVLMSAYGFKDSGEKPQCELTFPQLTKPFSVDELVRLIREEEKKIEHMKKKHPERFEEESILIFCANEEGLRIQNMLETMGFKSKIIEPGNDFEKLLEETRVDLFLIDEDFINQQWKMLNTIDRCSPKKPVVFLTRKGGEQNFRILEDLAVAVLDKEKFFNDCVWTIDFIKKHAKIVLK